MTGLDEYLMRAATRERCEDVVRALITGRALTQDEIDVVRGMQLRLLASDYTQPVVGRRRLKEAVAGLRGVLDGIESLRTFDLEDAICAIEDLLEGAKTS